MIDNTVMTPEAIALREGKTIRVDGVIVSFSEKGRLNVNIPTGFGGTMLEDWLRRNCDVIGFKPISVEERAMSVPVKKPRIKKDDSEPLTPYSE